MHIFSKKHITADDNFNRWLVPPISISIHLCIGSVYAWSIFNPALTNALGVVTGSANDWSLNEVVWIFSVAIVFLGLAAAFAGKWLEEVDPITQQRFMSARITAKRLSGRMPEKQFLDMIFFLTLLVLLN